MTTEAAATERAEQILQCLKAEKVDRFIRDFKTRFRITALRLADLPARARLWWRRYLRRLLRIYIAFLRHPVHQFFDQVAYFLALPRIRILQHLAQLVAHRAFGHQVAFLQGAKNRVAECLHRFLGIHLGDAVELRLKATLKEEISELLDEFFQVDGIGRFTDVFSVFDEFHRWPQCDAMADLTTTAEKLVELPSRPIRILTLLLRLPRFFRIITAFFATADTTMRPQALKNHLCCRGRRSRIFAIADAESTDVLHQALDL